MDIKNVENAHYLQIDHKIAQLLSLEGVLLLPIKEAYKEFSWLKEYFKTPPKEGYFTWIFSSTDTPLLSCIYIYSSRIHQLPLNFIVLEEGVSSKIQTICAAFKENLYASHKGKTIVLLKRGSSLKLDSYHQWGKDDKVSSYFDFYLKEASKLKLTVRLKEAPASLNSTLNFYLDRKSYLETESFVLADRGTIKLKERIVLSGDDAKALSSIKMVADRDSQIFQETEIEGLKKSFARTDCKGLLISDRASIETVPKLIIKNKKALLDHEASVGSISQEILDYLKTRGIREREAIKMIVSGFLEE